jgi:hypothetical protein
VIEHAQKERERERELYNISVFAKCFCRANPCKEKSVTECPGECLCFFRKLLAIYFEHMGGDQGKIEG